MDHAEVGHDKFIIRGPVDLAGIDKNKKSSWGR